MSRILIVSSHLSESYESNDENLGVTHIALMYFALEPSGPGALFESNSSKSYANFIIT